MRVMLLSVRPRWARALIEGEKTIELRKRRIAAPEGTPVMIYETAPTSAIVATARLGRIVNCSAEAAWRDYKAGLGLTQPELEAYLAGKSAWLLFLLGVSGLPRPVLLADLRTSGRQVAPPQSYRYLPRDEDITRLLGDRDAVA
jgi:predicted transcriptional regulator